MYLINEIGHAVIGIGPTYKIDGRFVTSHFYAVKFRAAVNLKKVIIV